MVEKRKGYVMENTRNIAVVEMVPEIPITLQEYADQYDVCPKTVEHWFKQGKEVITVDIDSPDLSN